MLKAITKVLLFLNIFVLSACATILQGENQNFTAITMNDKTPYKTQCQIKNEEGAWQTVPYKIVSIHRDGNPMDIQCRNNLQTGVTQLAPDFNGVYLLLDLLLDACIFSCPIDGVNNAFYQYPSFVTIPMNEK
jgi:hypothetical protein